MLLTYVFIAIGGALGSMARFGVGGFVMRVTGLTFPLGTMLVNISGALVIGFFATLTGPDGPILASTHTRQFVMIGICGGYTTFSSFSLETMNLALDGQLLAAAANAVLSVVFCLIAVWLGYVAASALGRGG